jgi:carboxymethylenebutenolidase
MTRIFRGVSLCAGVMLAVGTACAQSAAPADPRTAMINKLVADEVALGSDHWRAERLALSPRHNQMVSMQVQGRKLQAFVVYPAGSGPAPVMLMVPEDQGLNLWARAMADDIAALGYIVVVPDLMSGLGPNGGGRESYTDLHQVFSTNADLPRTSEPQMTSDLDAWADYALKLPQSNGRLSATGFAWGGGRVWWFAAQRHDLAAAYVFYDAAPPPDRLAGVTAPVYGFYAEYDPRVMRSLPATIDAMHTAHKPFEPVIYPGTDHMFMRLGQEPRDRNLQNQVARDEAWVRYQHLLLSKEGL